MNPNFQWCTEINLAGKYLFKINIHQFIDAFLVALLMILNTYFAIWTDPEIHDFT